MNHAGALQQCLRVVLRSIEPHSPPATPPSTHHSYPSPGGRRGGLPFTLLCPSTLLGDGGEVAGAGTAPHRTAPRHTEHYTPMFRGKPKFNRIIPNRHGRVNVDQRIRCPNSRSRRSRGICRNRTSRRVSSPLPTLLRWCTVQSRAFAPQSPQRRSTSKV